MKATQEQQIAIDYARKGAPLAIEAMAGTGKSTTLKMVANALGGRRMLYTAFSAAVIADAKKGGFGSARIQSNHSLAYAKYGAAYRDAGRMERRLTPRVIKEVLGLRDDDYPGIVTAEQVAHVALEGILRFQQGADDVLMPHHFVVPALLEEVGDAARRVAARTWDEFCNPSSRLPVTHDTYLKRWALSNPRLPFDTILLDEAQDANGVIVDVLSRQDAQIIVVGDPNQQIFSWRGAVNAMDAFNIENRVALTQSFRFGNVVAEAANAVLLVHANSDRVVRGTPEIASRVGTFLTERGPHTEIARTNSTLIGRIPDLMRSGKRVAVVGGVNDMLKLIEGAGMLQRGQIALTCPDLMDFRDWDEVVAYAETDAGRDLSVLTRMVKEHGCARLHQIVAGVKDNEKDEARADVILTTAHRSKGREWDRVMLHDDFPVPEPSDLPHLHMGRKEGMSHSRWSPEEANLLYVAITRAKRVLDVEKVGAWNHAVDIACNLGLTLPGITDDPRFNPNAMPIDLDARVEEEAREVLAPSLVSVPDSVLDELFNGLNAPRKAERMKALAVLKGIYRDNGLSMPMQKESA